MPRRADITPRELEADPVHGSKLVTQFINAVMLDGKRSTAERLVYDALAIVAEKTGKAPVEALEGAIKTVTPVLEVRSRRVGGATGHYFFFTPYCERAFVRSLTPAASSVPRTTL